MQIIVNIVSVTAGMVIIVIIIGLVHVATIAAMNAACTGVSYATSLALNGFGSMRPTIVSVTSKGLAIVIMMAAMGAACTGVSYATRWALNGRDG